MVVLGRGGWHTAQQIAPRISQRPHSTSKVLSRLFDEGVVERRDNPCFQPQHQYRLVTA